MTMYAFARLAWTATLGGVAAAWAYLAVIPTTGTYWLDNTVAIALVLAGVLTAGLIERRLELALGANRGNAPVQATSLAPARDRVEVRAS